MSNRLTTHRQRRWLRASQVLALALLLAFVAGLAGPALAQDYYFAVPRLQLQVFIEADGTARLVYDITFENEPSGRDIDVVDIGLPTADYQISNMRASIDGVELSDIRPSEYVKPGVEIHLNGWWIDPGATGTLHFEATIPNLLFQDVTNSDYASFQITPTWFGDEYVSGFTDVQIAIHLPEGISPEELLYQNEAFGQRALFEDHAVALWDFPAERLTGPNLVGVSFPAAGIAGVQRMTALDLAERWFVAQTTLRWVLGILAAGIFTYIFMRFTGGTGLTLWVIGLAGLAFLFYRWPLSQLAIFLPLLPGLYLVEKARKKRRAKAGYLPPIAQVEGGGIKRGLTAPEAAALLEMPLNKVLTLIIFGLLKKGTLRQISEEPFQVEIAQDFRTEAAKGNQEAGRKLRKRAAQQAGVVLHGYEHLFLDAIEAKPDTPLPKIDFSAAMDAFLVNLAKRVKGFDLSDTQEYYQAIVRRAVEQAKTIPDIATREQSMDRDMEWILLDNDYPTVFNTPAYSYRPIWARGSGGSGSGLPSLSPGGSESGGAPSFSNVAAGFAGWTENTMGSLASAISPGSLPSLASKSGFVNLSGVDKVTGDVFQALASSSRSGGGGGGGGSSCACAGCACACACAGGGR